MFAFILWTNTELMDFYYLTDPKNLILYRINSVLLYFETKFHLKTTFFNKIDNFAKTLIYMNIWKYIHIYMNQK